MQIICMVEGSSDDYFSNEKQRSMRPPSPCPHCNSKQVLRALGYYDRDVSRLNEKGYVRISVRRFRCIVCGKTVSLLPSFAQPYRIVLNATIQAFAAGDIYHPDVEWWIIYLRRYWKRFCFWLPLLRQSVPGIGLSPPSEDAAAYWRQVVIWAGSLSSATARLTSDFQITLFGRYRCHVPNRCEGEI
ncbi:MAG: DUF6431 domain-containing protein [Terrimicrobiaceae bacterium]|nr:DUF6431 domain-containing protein [Terrimicrobiaceae bacterium]